MQVRQYAPAIGEKKIMAHIKKGHFKAKLDGGEWVIDRFSIDSYFLEDQNRRAAFVESTVAKLCGVK